MMKDAKLFELNPDRRQEILFGLVEILEREPRLCFAYLYGSFSQKRPFHDIDLAVYLTEADGDNWQIQSALSEQLEQSLRQQGLSIPIDVRVLNSAPLGFRYQAFRGDLLFSRDEILRIDLVSQTAMRYLDMLPLKQQALREAMAAWA